MLYKEIIQDEENLIRVDVFVVKLLEDFSRSKVQKMFQEGLITVNDELVKASYILKMDDVVNVKVILEEKEIKPINLNLEVLHEDEELLVIYKPAGLIVHPSESSNEVTLVNHLLYHTKNLSLKGGSDRPGIVHRLDKDTSGILVVAKTDNAYDFLVNQFKERTIKREYLAIVHHPFKEDSGTINLPIIRDRVKMVVSPNGKEAITHFNVIDQNETYSFLKCSLETGRTHQIRVHLAYINHPIVADLVYGKSKKFKNYYQALHAKKLEFIHPTTKKRVSFKKKPPKEFLEILKKVDLSF